MTDLVIRPLAAGEETLFLSMPEPPLVGVTWLGRDFRATVATRRYRPEWTWVALRDGAVVARAAWWGGPDDPQPLTLDWFDPGTDPDAGAELLRAAPYRSDYCLILPPGWRADGKTRAAAEARIAVAGAAGMRPFVERLHYTWTPADGLPPRPTRLSYAQPASDDDVFDVLRAVHSDTLDAHAVRAGDADAAARAELENLRWLPGPPEWWRLAYTADGQLAGIAVPSRNYTNPVIAFIGVVPGQRGHGYAFDLLAEATHLLVEQGAERIAADTDTTNTPMAATFARAGYPVTQHRLMLGW